MWASNDPLDKSFNPNNLPVRDKTPTGASSSPIKFGILSTAYPSLVTAFSASMAIMNGKTFYPLSSAALS
jgi:hypothetical protein